ncbi:carbohydrate binding family 9 domain-containing protein [Thalassotalea sp. LPB0316]|uniref:carbohydrate binding family 9 domain-containing protein n=1 Tax=Thalassotalea sp. LPB0316 TaxID=2769490 RepID=UPI001865ABAB|nr:carbohydrate binding family 9 domain-containing protein [Thalassotalea sp. LPB0316]QOL25205.1 carbohydrate binding family 9 domain-containing protein [Thalassotalea sp. LPB0316]
MRPIWQALVASFTALSLHAFAADKQPPTIAIPKVSGEITIDAKLDEPQWQNARKVLVNNVTRPYDNIPSPVNTEALLMEDGETFYIAFIAQDPDPSQIRAFLRDRDRSWGDDIVGIKIDAYNDQRRAYRFLANALGVQIDGIENAVTGRESDSWDGIWQSKGEINEQGYIVEMALPLRMLNFKEGLDIQQWGIELVRFYPRQERLRLSNIYLDRDNNCELCQLAVAQGFSGAKQGNNLTITPSAVIGRLQTREDDGEWQDEDTQELSLNVRWGITPDILLNATINPDFSTVETDNAQLSINNTFALFFDEKRPFFLDNADYFESDYNLVYTRNINAPNYGAKLTGRHGEHSLGLFITDDETTNILIPGNRSSSVGTIEDSSQAMAMRYRYNINQDITLGWISTMRNGNDYKNQVHGIDGNIRFSESDTVKFQTVYSNTLYPEDFYQQFCDADDPLVCQDAENSPECSIEEGCAVNELVLRTQKDGDFSGNAFKAEYRHSDRDWFYRAFYNQQNAGFRGDLGFMSRVDHQRAGVALERKWYADPGNWWNRFNIYSDYDITHNDNGELIEEEYDINANISAKYESYIRVGYTYRDVVGSRIDKSDLAITGNTTLFHQNVFSIFGEIKPISGLYLNTRVNWGDGIDYANNRAGKKLEVRPTINWSVNQHLEFKLRHTYRELDADNANVFIARLTDLRTTYQFNVQSYLRFSLIYNNTSRNPFNAPFTSPEDIEAKTRNVSTELLYAYKINPQTVFYTGYSDNHYTVGDFSELEQDERGVFMKFSYAWLK